MWSSVGLKDFWVQDLDVVDLERKIKEKNDKIIVTGTLVTANKWMVVTTSNLWEISFWRCQYVTYLVDTRIKNLCHLLAI